jgi:hypothetical protein
MRPRVGCRFNPYRRHRFQPQPSVTGYREFFEWMTLLRATPPGHSPSPSINGSCDEQKSSPTDEPEKQDTR